jgi:hypothetical protein
MKLKVTYLTLRTVTLDVHPSERIEGVKERLQELTDIPTELQSLWLRGRTLRDGGSLADFGVLGDARLYLLRRLEEASKGH